MGDVMVVVGDLVTGDLVAGGVVVGDLVADGVVDDFTASGGGIDDAGVVGLANGFCHGLMGCTASGVDLGVGGVVGTGMAGVVGGYCSCLDNN